MTIRQAKTLKDIRAALADRAIKQVKIGVFDIDGVMRGKYMSRDKFLSAIEGGFGFCDVVLGWDVNDQLYDNTNVTGWHNGYRDAQVRVLLDSGRELPTEDNMVLFLGEFAGDHEAVCPRAVLRRVLDRAASMGFTAYAGCEYEFLALRETNESLREKGYRNLLSLGTGNGGYSVIRNSVNADFYRTLLNLCEEMDMQLEGLHEETGPGALEAAIGVDGALAAADKAALFKTFSKVLAQQQGRFVSFIAKWDASMPGQGGHVHISLRRQDGSSAFYDAEKPQNIGDTMRHFIGGQQRLLPQMAALIAPTVNSYKRLVPGMWAPTAATWGIDNRTVALRAIPGSAKSQRVEVRIPGADANPYLVLAASIAAGLWGIETGAEPGPPSTGNAYLETAPAEQQLPIGLGEAAKALRGSAEARELLGDVFVEHFAATREWEEREYRKQVSDWELARYMEII